MSNYPAGAENDRNAPYNQKDLQGDYVGLFEDILATGELNYDTTQMLNEFSKKRDEAYKILTELIEVSNSLENSYFKNKLFKIKELITEPTLFID